MYDLSNFRKNYSGKSLEINTMPPHPLEWFKYWFNDAVQNEWGEANAMIVSTTDNEGKPHSRVVLLKDFSEEGFVFFTNYESQKGKQIDFNNTVALLFFWQKLQRQVRIEGITHKVSPQRSDEYFYSRPYESQIAAMVSKQSQILKSKTLFIQEYEKSLREHQPIRPSHWGGYIVKPYYFEFWQGQPNRLHDRVSYRLENNNWIKYLLYP
ncbi:MAG: pyridoxamine 5'-phosphate oxidase [Bacteroidales bacterium]|nr:pyridoxamine 5'-phosphate oxidase [Bacteroidales bacterium]